MGGAEPVHFFWCEMQIGQCVYEALTSNNPVLFGVVADWIEDHKSTHPEANTYMARLRAPRIRIRTLIDVVCKFGSRSERKLYSRINRIVLKMRHTPERALPIIEDVFSMEDRRRLNRRYKYNAESRARKKPILTQTRKRTALENSWWYIHNFKLLLSKHY